MAWVNIGPENTAASLNGKCDVMMNPAETKTVYRFLSDICDGFVRQAFVQWDLFKA